MNATGLILCAFLVGQVKAPPPSGADPRCGGVCLYVALKSLDLAPSSYAELEGGLGRPTTAGYSMQQLEDYAKGRGATTLAVETSLANLRVRERPFACIALVEPAHFLLISEVDDRLVHLIDPPNQATVPLDTFNATWSRKALLLSRSPFLAEATLAARRQGRRWFGWLAATAGLAILVALVAAARHRRAAMAVCWLGWSVVNSGCSSAPSDPTESARQQAPRSISPRLVFDPEHHDLGTIYASTPAPTRTIRTTIKNEGDQPATILAVMPSCLCTTESLSARQIAPHSAAELTLTVRLGDSPEPRRTLIQVRSDDPHRPEVPITVNWQVRPALATEPITLYWGDLQPGERRQAKLAICATEIGLCERCELISLTDLGEISHQIKLEPMTNASHDDPARLRGGRHKVGELHVELRCPFEVTTQQTSLDLLLKCRNEVRARLAIPVSWSVVPLWQIAPHRLSLGAQPANTLVPGKIVIRSPRGTAFTIRKVRDETDRVKLSITLPAEARSTHSLATEIHTPSTQGPWSTRLTVSTDLPGAETLVLPVSGYTPE